MANEETQQNAETNRRKLKDLISHLCDSLNCAADLENADDASDMVIEKVWGRLLAILLR